MRHVSPVHCVARCRQGLYHDIVDGGSRICNVINMSAFFHHFSHCFSDRSGFSSLGVNKRKLMWLAFQSMLVLVMMTKRKTYSYSRWTKKSEDLSHVWLKMRIAWIRKFYTSFSCLKSIRPWTNFFTNLLFFIWELTML